MKCKPVMLFFLVAFLAIPFSLLLTHSAYAKLPAHINGQPLPSLADMLEVVTPAVVNISAEGTQVMYDPSVSDPVYRHFFGNQLREKKTKGTGSGIIVDANNGYIITNSHVIEGANRIMVTLNDNRQLPARVIGQDPKADVAVIQVKNKQLVEMTAGDSEKLRVGDFVVAIGNPYGLGQSVSSGIVSALGRNNLGIEHYENFIQTDAPINPGNSGGALVNLRGELIGINTAILGGKTGGNVGIGFAIPINMVLNIMDQLINYGEVSRGQLGVLIQDLTQEIAQSLNAKTYKGAVIARVYPNSPADQAGLEEGDIIVAINNKAVRNGGDVRIHISNIRIGQPAQMRILRNGQTLNITTVVGEEILRKEIRQETIRQPASRGWNYGGSQ